MDIVIDSFNFRKLKPSDLELLHNWLNSPSVNQWYRIFQKVNPSHDDIVKKYLPRIQEKDPTFCYLILENFNPVGLIQFYLLNDYPKTKQLLDIQGDVAGIDIFIGAEEYLHKGYGNLIIKKFLKEVVFTRTSLDSCIIDPEPNNQIAIDAYKKAGFEYLKTVINTEENSKAYVMIVSRSRALAAY
jgi:RimJ/RimL family protein N-acetyltransferase